MNDDLLTRMCDTDPDVRREAIENLFLGIDESQVSRVLDLVESDRPEEIRADAAIALGPLVEDCGNEYFEASDDFESDFGPPIGRASFAALQQRLRAVYEDSSQPELVRRRAFETLVRDPQQWHRAEVEKHFGSAERGWRLTAVFAMGYVAGFEPELLQILDETDPELLAEALRAAGRMEIDAGERIEGLAASESADTSVRVEAILALPYVAAESAAGLLERLSEDSNEEIAMAAGEALEELGMLLDDGDVDE